MIDDGDRASCVAVGALHLSPAVVQAVATTTCGFHIRSPSTLLRTDDARDHGTDEQTVYMR